MRYRPPEGSGACPGRNDRGAETHHEGGGDAGPEQALRQRKHQHQDRARAGPHADGKDGAEAALPATGAGELIRRRPVRMAAMLVVNVTIAKRVVVAVGMVMALNGSRFP